MILPAFWRPRAPYFGVHCVSTSAMIGTGGTSVGNTTTTSVILPKPSSSNVQLARLSINALVAAVSAGQTVTIQVYKRDNSGTPTDRAVTGTFSLTTSGLTSVSRSFAFPITATSAQNVVFDAADIARIDVIASGTVSTQPTVTVTATWALIRMAP